MAGLEHIPMTEKALDWEDKIRQREGSGIILIYIYTSDKGCWGFYSKSPEIFFQELKFISKRVKIKKDVVLMSTTQYCIKVNYPTTEEELEESMKQVEMETMLLGMKGV